jgi:hypothetical protein
MRLDVKALAKAFAVVWGAAVLFAGLAHLIWPSYAGAFLDMVASIYPGYHVGGFGSVIIGTLYAIVDGGVGGLVLAWLYNTFAASVRPQA